MKHLLPAAIVAAVLTGCNGTEGPKSVTLKGVTLRVESFRRDPDRKYGMMKHSLLPDEACLLSSWPRDRFLHYFTQDCEGDYAVAFLDAAGKVLEIRELPRNNAKGVTSTLPARHALFLREGWAARHGLAVGDVAQLSPGLAAPADPMTELSIDGATVHVELATVGAERQRGLMHRPRLSPEEGMLFAYPKQADHSFWMQNTLIPLDIAFFDAKGELVGVSPLKPAEDPEKHGADVKTPPFDSQFVLELNYGWFAAHGISDPEGKILKKVTVSIPAAVRTAASEGGP